MGWQQCIRAGLLVHVRVHALCLFRSWELGTWDSGGRQHSGGRPRLNFARWGSDKKEDAAFSPFLRTTGVDRLDNINTT